MRFSKQFVTPKKDKKRKRAKPVPIEEQVSEEPTEEDSVPF